MAIANDSANSCKMLKITGKFDDFFTLIVIAQQVMTQTEKKWKKSNINNHNTSECQAKRKQKKRRIKSLKYENAHIIAIEAKKFEEIHSKQFFHTFFFAFIFSFAFSFVIRTNIHAKDKMSWYSMMTTTVGNITVYIVSYCI